MPSPTPSHTTETRTYVGDSGNQAFDGFAGFRRGRQYQLSYERRGDGTVAVVLDHHAHVGQDAGPLVVSEAEFEKWWGKMV